MNNGSIAGGSCKSQILYCLMVEEHSHIYLALSLFHIGVSSAVDNEVNPFRCDNDVYGSPVAYIQIHRLRSREIVYIRENKMVGAVDGKSSELRSKLSVGPCYQDIHLLQYFPQK